MSIVKMHNKKTGVTYVYESESYWDKEKQQPRNRRKLIGKIDPETGEIVPTGRPGRKPKSEVDIIEGPAVDGGSQPGDYERLLSVIDEKNREIASLKDRIRDLEFKCDRYRTFTDRIRSVMDEFED